MQISIIGAGAWGTALAITLQSNGHQVTLVARDAGAAGRINAARCNQQYLPGANLPPGLKVVDQREHQDPSESRAPADLHIVATPVVGLRAALTLLQARTAAPVLWLCKGFEPESAKMPHEIAREAGYASAGALTGPSFAEEVARGLPVALTLASTSPALRALAPQLHGGNLRIYTSDDVIGAELGGALKNVMAIATGIADGMALGMNARAALITRGLAEMTRLGIALGARPETFMGLTGMGDLILTCTGALSRNRKVGLSLAAGNSLTQTLESLGHVAEGVNAAREALQLGQRHIVDLPITQAVHRVLFEGLAPKQAMLELLARDQRAE